MKFLLRFYAIFICLYISYSIKSKRLKTELSPRFSKNQTEAFCFLNDQGTVYDLLTLYDAEDYTFESHNTTYIMNFCKFTTSKCRKDNTFVIGQHKQDEQDCHLLTGTNPTLPSKWMIISN
jgi:hypothetical protein